MTQKTTSPLKVLHVLPSLDVGGIEKGIVDIYQELAPQNYQFDVLIEKESDSMLAHRIKALGGTVHIGGRFKSWGFLMHFMRCVQQNGPYDAVHSHCYYFSGLVMALAFFAKVPRRIAHIHSANRARKRSLLASCYYRALKLLMDVFATHILAVSTVSAQSFAEGRWQKHKKIALRPMGVDFSAFTAAAPEQAPLLTELGIEGEAKCIVHVGRFTQEKNQHFIVDLFRSLYEMGVVSHLVLIGDGPLKAALENDAEVAPLVLSGAIIFTGLRDDCPALLSALQGRGLFVFPSLYEGFGLAAVEAQCAGLPVLASDHVPDAVGIIPHYFKQLSLSAPISAWCDAAQDLFECKGLSAAQCKKYMQDSGLSVQDAAADLRRYYDAV